MPESKDQLNNKEETLDKKLEEAPLKRERDDTSDSESSKIDDNTDTKRPRTATLESEKKDTDVTSKEQKSKEDDEKEASDALDKNKTSEENGLQKVEEKKPKYVFGSSTSFGTGFSIAKPQKKVETEETINDKTTTSTSKPFSFGSGFAFGGGFQVLREDDVKKSKDDETEKKEETKEDIVEENTKPIESKKEEVETEDKSKTTDDGDADSKTNTESSEVSEHPSVKLQKQDVKSGEEGEEVVYQVNAKLYQLVDVKEGWKERGVGAIKINKNIKSNKYRLIMRSRALLKVILNINLVKGLTISKGFPSSLQSEKFIRIICINEDKTPVQYALRTGKKELADELYDKIQSFLA